MTNINNSNQYYFKETEPKPGVITIDREYLENSRNIVEERIVAAAQYLIILLNDMFKNQDLNPDKLNKYPKC